MAFVLHQWYDVDQNVVLLHPSTFAESKRENNNFLCKVLFRSTNNQILFFLLNQSTNSVVYGATPLLLEQTALLLRVGSCPIRAWLAKLGRRLASFTIEDGVFLRQCHTRRSTSLYTIAEHLSLTEAATLF